MVAHANIPLLYRLTLLYAEPLLATYGAFMLFTSPAAFLAKVSPHPCPSSVLAPVRVLTDQLASMQLLFAFNSGVLLQLVRDARVWRIACAGMLVSDVLHVVAGVRELRRDEATAAAAGAGPTWRWEELAGFGILAWVAMVRVGVVLGIGMGGGSGDGQREKLGKEAVRKKQ